MTDFSSYTFCEQNLTALKQHLCENIDLLDHWSEAQSLQLEALIAERHGISADSVLLTAGSTAAVYQAAALFHGSASIIPQPTGTDYAAACHTYGHIVSNENTEILTDIPKDRVYWICNPNDPSGNVLMKGFVDYIVKRSPKYTFVIDQSYEAYTSEPLLKAVDVKDQPNVLILHSLDKTYGVEALRLGYITAHPNTVSLLRSRQQPRTWSPLTIEAGRFLLENCPTAPEATGSIEEFIAETETLRNAIRDSGIIRVYETKAGMMLCEMMKGSTQKLKEFLADGYDISISTCHAYYGLSASFFRLVTQTPELNARLAEAIAEFARQEKEPKA